MIDLEGIINLYKPTEITCADLVNQIFKKRFKIKKVGYAGTLDKFAEGVLPVLLNSATKISKFLEANDKEYIATIKLGEETDTLDLTGNIIKQNTDFKINQPLLEKTLKSFVGEIKQDPPKFSAIKIRGQRASDRTRQGEKIKLLPRIIKIYSIDLINMDCNQNLFSIKVKCSKGTFIRALARDIGKKLNSGGTVIKLIRSRNGLFTVEEAITKEKLENTNYLSDLRIYPINEVLRYYPTLTIKSNYIRDVINGKKLNRFNFFDFGDNLIDGIYKICNKEDKLFAIVEYKREKFYYLKVFQDVN